MRALLISPLMGLAMLVVAFVNPNWVLLPMVLPIIMRFVIRYCLGGSSVVRLLEDGKLRVASVSMAEEKINRVR